MPTSMLEHSIGEDGIEQWKQAGMKGELPWGEGRTGGMRADEWRAAIFGDLTDERAAKALEKMWRVFKRHAEAAHGTGRQSAEERNGDEQRRAHPEEPDRGPERTQHTWARRNECLMRRARVRRPVMPRAHTGHTDKHRHHTSQYTL